jgi:hypothetical protein
MAPTGLVLGKTNLSCNFSIGSNIQFKELLCNKQATIHLAIASGNYSQSNIEKLIKFNTHQSCAQMVSIGVGGTSGSCSTCLSSNCDYFCQNCALQIIPGVPYTCSGSVPGGCYCGFGKPGDCPPASGILYNCG